MFENKARACTEKLSNLVQTPPVGETVAVEAAGIAAGLARAKNEPDVQGEVNAAAELKATEIKNECGGTVQSRGGTLVEQASASKCLVDNPIVLVGRAGDYASWPCVVPHLSLPFGLGRR